VNVEDHELGMWRRHILAPLLGDERAPDVRQDREINERQAATKDLALPRVSSAVSCDTGGVS
jgi:hypothetical protein